MVHGQSQDTDKKSVQVDNMSEVIHQLTTHQDHTEQQSHKEQNRKEKKKQKLQNNIIKTNKRLTRNKPKDGNYEEVRLIDLTQQKVNRVKRQLTTHQEKSQTVYVKKEVITKINRLQQEGIVNVDVADSGLVSLAIAEQELSNETKSNPSLANNEDSSTNTLATFTIGAQNSSANHLYRITKDGKYQYQDGKEIVGGKKYKEWFKNGYKPITETTFYYEIAQLPHIDLEQENVNSFTSMSIEEQVALIKESIQRSSDYVELDKLASSKTSVLGSKENN